MKWSLTGVFHNRTENCWKSDLKILVKSSNPPHLGSRSKIQNEQIEQYDKIFRIFIITKNLLSLSPIRLPKFEDNYGAHTQKSVKFWWIATGSGDFGWFSLSAKIVRTEMQAVQSAEIVINIWNYILCKTNIRPHF